MDSLYELMVDPPLSSGGINWSVREVAADDTNRGAGGVPGTVAALMYPIAL